MSDQNFFSTADPLFPAKLTYALFALGALGFGFPTLAGLIYAYISRGKDAVADSHLSFLISSFWISLGLGILAVLTMLIGIGFLLLPLVGVWAIFRLVTGFMLLTNRQPVTGTQYAGAWAI